MPLSSLEIYIHTNSQVRANAIKAVFPDDDVKVKVFSQYNKVNHLHNSPWNTKDNLSPWYLTWEHKETLKQSITQNNKSAIYLCLEDDTLFTLGNLYYFIESKAWLKSHRLLPSFLQVEFDNTLQQFVAVGYFGKEKSDLARLPSVNLEEMKFVEMPNPYSGIIALDHELASEYVESDAFHEAASRKLTWWDIGARAAMGLQFVNPPQGFASRNVVPLNQEETGVDRRCWVIHQPNIYVEKRETAVGLTPDSLFSKSSN